MGFVCNGSNLDESEAQSGELVNNNPVLIESGCYAERIWKFQPESVNLTKFGLSPVRNDRAKAELQRLDPEFVRSLGIETEHKRPDRFFPKH